MAGSGSGLRWSGNLAQLEAGGVEPDGGAILGSDSCVGSLHLGLRSGKEWT